MVIHRPHISVVSPVYGASALLDELVERIIDAVSQLTSDFEILLVEDHSPDKSWDIITALCDADARIQGLKLARNFGQQYALAAGFANARGEWVVTLDCDLQDPPEEIIRLYKKANEGFDVVLASREKRRDGFLKRFFSRMFYHVLSYLTETEQDSSTANFSICKRDVIDAINSMGDYYRYFPAQVRWVGFNLTTLKVSHADRPEGRSGYSFRKRLRLSLDTIISFSDKPLRLAVKFGLALSFLILLVAIGLAVVYFTTRDFVVPGWASVFLSLWFLSGMLITVLGIVGLYLGKTFETVKGRPAFIISKYLNENEAG